ncbi:TetR family transcriptional regulator [Pseudoalteromonas denitrificans]|uniref:Transcriptional regulator, TetR family n=1 Tax=Pseudoalteromonas denitrificans DSM 6059 TaxID=1123010 RepID=A0A1I1PCR9_9GAMM|nr:TetR family transcriptional regulator [Pseudoalteromonas denitrificans]SFD04793.1 transcriptional regulator, TetR family [Pseudoalteromonas denitrificans DSM 6059]
MASVSKREHIISHALPLFYQNGFNATGIELIISQAGVSKKTLYKYFKSKDDLILSVLTKRDEIFRRKLIDKTEFLGKTAEGKLLALFDFLHAWFNEVNFFGCMFINASAEFTDIEHPSHIVCSEHKNKIKAYIKSLAFEANIKKSSELSAQLNILMEGAIVEAHVSGDKNSAIKAKKMAEVFINLALSTD